MKANPVEIPTLAATELKRATRDGYVVLMSAGRPVAYVLPTAYYDEEDIGYMTDPEFWKMIRERRSEEGGISLEELKAELGIRTESRSRKSGPRKTKNGTKRAN